MGKLQSGAQEYRGQLWQMLAGILVLCSEVPAPWSSQVGTHAPETVTWTSVGQEAVALCGINKVGCTYGADFMTSFCTYGHTICKPSIHCSKFLPDLSPCFTQGFETDGFDIGSSSILHRYWPWETTWAVSNCWMAFSKTCLIASRSDMPHGARICRRKSLKGRCTPGAFWVLICFDVSMCLASWTVNQEHPADVSKGHMQLMRKVMRPYGNAVMYADFLDFDAQLTAEAVLCESLANLCPSAMWQAYETVVQTGTSIWHDGGLWAEASKLWFGLKTEDRG